MVEKLTPIRQQYLKIKRRYPHAILLFRLGDFYETFDEDAEIASRELNIVLTARGMGKATRVPMAGIPYHALDNYLGRLIARGYKVAICEQVTKPGEGRGLVKREVVRVVTPGTVIEPSLLNSKANNYLAGVVVEGEAAGIAYVDVTTSEFAVTQMELGRAVAELGRLQPSEVILAQGADEGSACGFPVTRLENGWFDLDTARQVLLEHFGAATLEGYGCDRLPLAVRAAGAVVHYLAQTQKDVLGHLDGLATYSTDSFMALDANTGRNLALFRGSAETKEGSLLEVIDLTRTAAGGRTIRRWLGQPLLDIDELECRHDAVAWFHENTLARARVVELLHDIADLERIINRVRGGHAAPREVVSLRRSLETVPRLVEAMVEGGGAAAVGWLMDELDSVEEVVSLIAEAVEDEPASSVGEGGVIRRGFSEELDGLRSAAVDAKRYLANLEREERAGTGIKSLKVGYNKVFGYYIEVSKANLSQVPPHYIRKQTLVGGERFFTPQLKEYESFILNARDRMAEMEADLFRRVCGQVATYGDRVLAVAHALARVDVFSALAEAAARYGYVRPCLNGGDEIVIKQGRHPVVERALTDHGFVPNDAVLSNQDAQLIVLTGPNMSGKSTYLRQVALIVLMAQMGSFVPADAATIGIVDRIFTRIGAGEDIASGQSTFMVEMVEAANILNNATPRSLIILDEIGRGTSTYDGLSIARAVAEYIHNSPRLGTKTLFATHYHEMVEVAGVLPRVRNMNVAVSEEGGRVVFLYKIAPGGVDKSYGIHVAQLAGLPRAVVNRAGEVLAELEAEHGKGGGRPASTDENAQMPLFVKDSKLAKEIEKLDIDSLTPLEALTKLYELQKRARKEGS